MEPVPFVTASGDRLMAVIGEPVSLDHQLSLILASGAPYRCKSCWYTVPKVTSDLSPPRKSPFRDLRPPALPILFKCRCSRSFALMALKAALWSQLGDLDLKSVGLTRCHEYASHFIILEAVSYKACPDDGETLVLQWKRSTYPDDTPET